MVACRTCKWWSQHSYDENFGYCSLTLTEGQGGAEIVHKQTKAFVQMFWPDDAGIFYSVALATDGDFSCSQYEEMENHEKEPMGCSREEPTRRSQT